MATKPPLDSSWEDIIRGVPAGLRQVVREVAADPALNEGVVATMDRVKDFRDPVAALLAGVVINPVSRRRFDDHMDEKWAKDSRAYLLGGEVVVGAGLHAAIYCAVRFLSSGRKTLVLEKSDRVGGAFAVSRNPAFYLNSRNRPGPLSIPGEMGSLNFMPGAMLQPSELGGSEYQTNDALAIVIRMTLVMCANVRTGVAVTDSEVVKDGVNVALDDGTAFKAVRLVWATGLGKPADPTGGLIEDRGGRFLTFDEFMSRMDSPYPLRGMDRVAVVGGGDGARTVIEALTGQGPSRGYSVAALDWPKKIDWYGAPWLNCVDWLASSRSRYKPIAALLPDPRVPAKVARVNPLPVASSYAAGYDCAYVGQQPYDYVIVACGSDPGRGVPYDATEPFSSAGRNIGRAQRGKDKKEYIVGPASMLEVGTSEREILRGISENSTSIFRYAPRTAALAETVGKEVNKKGRIATRNTTDAPF